jgi:choline dehydrogenase-like flavoprotein
MAARSLGGVVDPNLKVYGLQNVRIIDAGIFPLTIGVPIQPTVYAIAEKVCLQREAYVGLMHIAHRRRI